MLNPSPAGCQVLQGLRCAAPLLSHACGHPALNAAAVLQQQQQQKQNQHQLFCGAALCTQQQQQQQQQEDQHVATCATSHGKQHTQQLHQQQQQQLAEPDTLSQRVAPLRPLQPTAQHLQYRHSACSSSSLHGLSGCISLHEAWGRCSSTTITTRLSSPHCSNSHTCNNNHVSNSSRWHGTGPGSSQRQVPSSFQDRLSNSSRSPLAFWGGLSSSSNGGSSRGYARRAAAASASASYIIDELNRLREGEEAQGGLTPAAVVDRLDKVIIGQEDAKRAVAIAFRNRWRRQRVSDPEMRREITPKNLLLIGPTGCGKTEIARRLAKLAEAPFCKVEATKFTEVGYHGRDVDQIIRDLVETAIGLVKRRCKKAAARLIADAVEHTIVSAMLGPSTTAEEEAELRRKYRAGELDQERVSIDVPQQRSGGDGPGFVVQGGSMSVSVSLAGMMGGPAGGPAPAGSERRSMTVAEARELLEDVEAETVLPPELLAKEAVRVAEQEGIVFIDEIDKIVNPSGSIRHGSDPSAEGVQRDLLPLIEGSVINTKHGPVATDHILFIASGAFTAAKPSDMMAELQGRLPIRVELRGLTAADFERILTEPECNMIYQQQRLLGCEGVKLEFTSDAIKEVAVMAEQINKEVENIGARRLHTVLERLVEDISFEAPDKVAEVQQQQQQANNQLQLMTAAAEHTISSGISGSGSGSDSASPKSNNSSSKCKTVTTKAPAAAAAEGLDSQGGPGVDDLELHDLVVQQVKQLDSRDAATAAAAAAGGPDDQEGVQYECTYVIDKQQVQEKLKSLLQQEDFNKYIL